MTANSGADPHFLASRPSPSQTLSRGVRALEVLAEAANPLTIVELADALGVHRSVAYRILRTLEDHSLLTRDDTGRFQLGSGLTVLARNVSRDLQTAALPELATIANRLNMTAFVTIWDRTECVTLAAVEPRHPQVAVVQRPGARQPVGSGAPGIAIQSALSQDDWHRALPIVPYCSQATTARELGYAESHDEVTAALSSVAAPILVPGGRPAALAVVYIRSNQDAAAIGAELSMSAARIANQLH